MASIKALNPECALCARRPRVGGSEAHSRDHIQVGFSEVRERTGHLDRPPLYLLRGQSRWPRR